MRWTLRFSLALMVLAVAIAIAVAARGLPAPTGQPLPSGGAPQVGIAYRVTFSCPASFTIGGAWWDFDDYNSIEWPPRAPAGLFDDVGDPHPVPGILTLTSDVTGNFVADVDQSVLPVSKSLQGETHPPDCL